MRRLAIVGGGAWGTALAMVALRAGSLPILWARDPDVVAAINDHHQNPLFLPGVTLDPTITATTDLTSATDGAEAALLAVPAQFLRGALKSLGAGLGLGTPWWLCSKGTEPRSLKTMPGFPGNIRPPPQPAVLSGQPLAAEVARGF